MSLDEFEQMFQKVERRLRDARVVAVLGNAELRADNKADFQDKENMERLAAAVNAAQVPATVVADEEHSAWTVMFHDSTNAERHIGVNLAARSGVQEIPVAGAADRQVQRAAVCGGARRASRHAGRCGRRCWLS